MSLLLLYLKKDLVIDLLLKLLKLNIVFVYRIIWIPFVLNESLFVYENLCVL